MTDLAERAQRDIDFACKKLKRALARAEKASVAGFRIDKVRASAAAERAAQSAMFFLQRAHFSLNLIE